MRWTAAIILLLMICPGLSSFSVGITINQFEGGTGECLVMLNAPDYRGWVNITLPARSLVLNATMNLSGFPADGNVSLLPMAPSASINGSVLWAYNGTGYGAFGFQDTFIDGSGEARRQFGQNGGMFNTRIHLPRDAQISSAMMEIACNGSEKMIVGNNISGPVAEEELGSSVANAGDVNGDGYNDTIVGVPEADSGRGRAYLYFGGPSADSTPDVTFRGKPAQFELMDLFGKSVAGAGDVNNDGYDDVIIGAPLNGDAGNRYGSAYIFFGGKNMNNLTDVHLYGHAGLWDGEWFGLKVSGAGDVNNDGYDDVIVAGPLNSTGGTYAGQVYLYLGGSPMNSGVDITFTGYDTSANFGESLAGAGDVNNDSYDDIIIGDGRKVYVHLGGSPMDNTADITFTGTGGGDGFGYSADSAGDINRDGYCDIIIGAPFDDNAGTDAGRAYICYGGTPMDSLKDVTLPGEAAGDGFGGPVSGARDINGDGYDDVVIGACGSNASGADSGRAYVFFGGPAMDSGADIILDGSAAGDGFGVVSDAGDVNKDGHNEIIVGAPGSNSTGPNSGSVYIFIGKKGVLDSQVRLGNQFLWNFTGFLNGTAQLDDFSQIMNTYLRAASSPLIDPQGNPYFNVSLDIIAKSDGNITLRKLKIAYGITATTRDFAGKLNGYINANRNLQDHNGNLKIPINISAAGGGKLLISGLGIVADEPPRRVKTVPDLTIDEDSAVSGLFDLNGFFEDDFDSGRLTLSAIVVSNSSPVMVGISAGRFLSVDALTGDLNDNWTGTVQAKIACTDSHGLRNESNEFVITVRNVNDPPVVVSEPATTAARGVDYRYQIVAVDGDGDSMNFSIANGPSGMGIDSNGLTSWFPNRGGKQEIAIRVSDGQGAGFQNFTLTVPNTAPRFVSIPPGNATVGTEFVYDARASDSDNDTLSYSVAGAPGGLVIDSITGHLTWTPLYTGKQNVSLKASDGDLSAFQNFTIDVARPNSMPVFVSVPPTNATTGILYVYTARATDADGDLVSYSLRTAPVGMVLDNRSGRLTWTPGAGQTGMHDVVVVSSDGKGGTAEQAFQINALDGSITLRPACTITSPLQGSRLEKKSRIQGTATPGVSALKSVELRIDNGTWLMANGISAWTFNLDTTTLKNGEHILEARTTDGSSYSDIVTITFSVDNQSTTVPPEFSSWIPAAGAFVIVAVVVGLLIALRKRNTARLSPPPQAPPPQMPPLV